MSTELHYVDPDFGQDWRIISPSTVLNRMRELDAQADLVQAVVSDDRYTGQIASQDGGTEFIRAWATFYGEWKLFFRDNQDWFSRFTSGVVSQAENYAARFNALEERLRSFNIVDPGTPTRSAIEQATPSYMPLIWGGLVVTGIFGVAWLLREGRGVAREARMFQPPTESPTLVPAPGVAGVPCSLLPSLTR